MEIAVGMHQHQGKREYQQDAMSIKHFGSIGVLAILADGMGGYEGGEIASKIVSENFREFMIEGDDIGASLKKYLLKGNESISEYKENHPEVKSMGTTAISFFMTDKICQWVSVGDSPLYIIRNYRTISRINENHSIAGLLDLQVKKGEITQEEALSSRQRHMLTSAVSGDNIPQIDLSVPYSIKENDIFILASDGIETISDDRIKEIVLRHIPIITQENAQNACEALIEEVISKNTSKQDNVTVIILAKIDDDEPQTILYEPLLTDKKRRLLSVIGGGVIVLLLAAGLFLYYSSNDEDEEKSAINTSQASTAKQQKDETQVAVPPKVLDKNESSLASTVSTQHNVAIAEEDNSSKKQSEEEKSSKKPDSAKKESGTKPEAENKNKKPQKLKESNKKEQKEAIEQQHKPKRNIIQVTDKSPKDIKKEE